MSFNFTLVLFLLHIPHTRRNACVSNVFQNESFHPRVNKQTICRHQSTEDSKQKNIILKREEEEEEEAIGSFINADIQISDCNT